MRLAIALMCGITILGVFGFCMIEGWDVSDAFYMTVITLSTVGYGEVHPMSPEGRFFAALLITVGIGVAIYCFNVIGRSAVEGELFHYRRFAQMQKRIAQLQDHIIICGYGRLSGYLMPELEEHKKDIVVIENDPRVIIDLEVQGIPYVEGSAYDDSMLEAAGIKKAESLLALLPEDADNVFVTLSARYLNPKVKIISRAETDDGDQKMRRAGANYVIAPFRVSSTRIIQQLLHTHVSDFLEITTGTDEKPLAIEQIIVPSDCRFSGQTLEEAEIRKLTGVTIVAMIGQDRQVNSTPKPTSVISPGLMLIALGTRESLEKFSDLIESKA